MKTWHGQINRVEKKKNPNSWTRFTAKLAESPRMWTGGDYSGISKFRGGSKMFVRLCSVTQACLTLWFYGLYLSRLLCPWDSPGRNTEGDCHFLLQGIFPPQGSNQHLLNLLTLAGRFLEPPWKPHQNLFRRMQKEETGYLINFRTPKVITINMLKCWQVTLRRTDVPE